MGADIHAIIEVQENGPNGQHWWRGFAYVNWARCRSVFHALGVHGNNEHVPQRGFPVDASQFAIEEYSMTISKDGSLDARVHDYPEVEESAALELVESGESVFLEINPPAISKPGWESPNWVTLAELRDCESKFPEEFARLEEYQATRCVLDFYMSRDYTVRLVYWFDV
ncbi:hypothetical protein OT109_12530 [Phycisphaeraceae bacterium D3-23]